MVFTLDPALVQVCTPTHRSSQETAARSVRCRTEAELESEHGCLVWSFDLSVAGKSGVQEVTVDAGDGKVLSVKHETRRQEATERAAEHDAPR